MSESCSDLVRQGRSLADHLRDALRQEPLLAQGRPLDALRTVERLADVLEHLERENAVLRSEAALPRGPGQVVVVRV